MSVLQAVVGRFAEDFVEERRRSLEMFIKRVVAHPILRETEQARVFLQGTDQVTSSDPPTPSTRSATAHFPSALISPPSLLSSSPVSSPRICLWRASSV